MSGSDDNENHLLSTIPSISLAQSRKTKKKKKKKISLASVSLCMETESWVERVIIQELARPDEREKYGYKTQNKRTAEFEWGCAELEKEMATVEGKEPPDLFNAIESKYQEAVADALEQLEQAGLITEIKRVPTDRMNHDEESLWELTEEGLREVQRLNEAWLRETVELAQKYGRVPNS